MESCVLAATPPSPLFSPISIRPEGGKDVSVRNEKKNEKKRIGPAFPSRQYDLVKKQEGNGAQNLLHRWRQATAAMRRIKSNVKNLGALNISKNVIDQECLLRRWHLGSHYGWE